MASRNGLRLYECYSDGAGTRRWRRFRSMGALDVERVLADVRVLADQLAEKVTFLEAVAKELRATGPDATVADVYDRVVTLRRPLLV